MSAAGLDAMVVTTEPEFRYFSGFHIQFWESPTRPWFLVVPADGRPIGVIPTIGAAGLIATWVDEIHTWSSPNPADDGVTPCWQGFSNNSPRITNASDSHWDKKRVCECLLPTSSD